ncbi:hypothetical protein [Streptomyces sp. NBRC 109706]|uniref:hypothetical protein n=1 Tax=Streptomyces sp. NBRC 109706 TaxID=1550035 RepID=UPI0007846EE7|nr:hypothetical protein [Streptomyces sp. NBRC 109706]
MIAPEPLTAGQALVRLSQYRERTSTWSTATYNDGTERALADIAGALATEVERLRAITDGPVCSEEAARAVGLDVPPGVVALEAMAETMLRAYGDEPSALADLGRAVLLSTTEIRRLRTEHAHAAAALAEQAQRYGRLLREHNADREELEQLRARITEPIQQRDDLLVEDARRETATGAPVAAGPATDACRAEGLREAAGGADRHELTRRDLHNAWGKAEAGGASQWATPAAIVREALSDVSPGSLTPAGRDYLHEAYRVPDAATVWLVWKDARAEGARLDYLERIAEVGVARAAGEWDRAAEGGDGRG